MSGRILRVTEEFLERFDKKKDKRTSGFDDYMDFI